jgi:hypothetical protein
MHRYYSNEELYDRCELVEYNNKLNKLYMLIGEVGYDRKNNYKIINRMYRLIPDSRMYTDYICSKDIGFSEAYSIIDSVINVYRRNVSRLQNVDIKRAVRSYCRFN